MAGATLGTVLRHIRHLAGGPGPVEMTDAELLERFVQHQDETAFEALVRRHGPMVHGVCRRSLSDPHDVEDAFQATFLVLVRKARSIGRRELLGNWLYGVAYRVALKARVRAAKRRTHERQVAAMPEAELPCPWTDRDLRQALDQEVHRLPMKYRTVLVLCYLEGKSSEEAAEQLNCPIGTVKSRLSRARDLLRERFARRGLTLSAGAVAALLAHETALASVPGPLVAHTVQAALLVAAGEAAGGGFISASAVALTKGVIQAMFLSKLKMAAALLVAFSLVGAGVGVIAHQALAEKPAADKPKEAAAKPEKPDKGDKQEEGLNISGTVKAVDLAKKTLTVIAGGKGKEKPPEEQILTLGADTKVFLPIYVKKDEPPQGKLADLQEGQRVDLELSADKKTVVRIGIQASHVSGIVKSVDAAKNTLTVSLMDKKQTGEQTYVLASDSKIYLPSKSKNKETKETPEGKLADLTEGVPVSLVLSFDLKTAHTVNVHAPSISGNVKAVDSAKSTITITTKGKEQASEHTFILAGDVQIILAGGKKDQVTEGKLSDLTEGLGVVLTLSLDRKQVVAIHVQAPSASGGLKKVDAAKRTITIGMKNEEMTYEVAADARIVENDGKKETERKLTDLTEGVWVNAQLALDKKTVQSMTVQGPSYQGGVRSVDAVQHTITIGIKGEGGQEDKTFAVAKDARITLADGTKNAEGKLTDLSDGLAVILNLSLDKQTVRAINATGPGQNGTVKSVDVGSKTITITVKEDGNLVDKTFEVAKAVNLSDVKDGVEVSLQLAVDKKTVIGVHVHKDKQ